jgi:hypothetical protein
MSFPESRQAYSLEGVAECAQELIRKNKEEEDPSSQTAVCIAIAGGGGHAISALSSTPGASSLLMEGIVTYDRKSYCSFTGLPANTKGFKYASYVAAKMASEAALKRALNYCSTNNLNRMSGCVGVGCASNLVTHSSKQKSTEISHANIVLTRAHGSRLYLNVTLAGLDVNGHSRSRVEEDLVVSSLVLRSIERMMVMTDVVTQEKNVATTDAGDIIEEQWFTSSSGDDGENRPDDEDAPFLAASRILSGEEQAVLLLPIRKRSIGAATTPERPTRFRALKYAIVPSGSLIFPGSFNPPHQGHVTLARAAVKAIKSTLEEDERSRPVEPPIFLELSITNADKPPIDPSTVSDRVHKMLELDSLPEKWGVLLTRAPLFADKMTCLNECIMEPSHGPLPKISFVIGSDTMLRIVDPKYYGHEQSAMVEAIRSMKGVHFVVGGRLEQHKDSTAPRRFVAGGQELQGLPEDIREMFTIIQEKDFRVDLSSSEIREQQEKVNGAPQR